MNNIPYLLALHSIDGLGPIRLKAILDYFRDPKLAWEAKREDLIQIGIPRNAVEILIETRKKLEPQTYAKAIKDSGISYVTVFDETYPKLLAQIYDPPVVLFYKGEIKDFNEKSIAVVGTRKITGYGVIVTEQFVKQLANAGLTIVSGLARGVDTQAHKTALKQASRTIAVLGGGLNKIYPPENKTLAEEIIKSGGAVVSEFAPDEVSLPGNFPARNRIISGLSLGVLVVEAAQDSGSLITAKLALEQGREVFAVPGPVTSTLSKGPINLIKMGATPVYEPLEILEELGLNQVQSSVKVQSINSLTDAEKKVMAVLENETRHIDEIGRMLNYPSAKISALLLKMEISGLLQNMGGGMYCIMR